MFSPSWVDDLFLRVRSTLPQLGELSQALVVAHAAYESGCGTAAPALKANNLFNITSRGWYDAPSAWERRGGRIWAQQNADWNYTDEDKRGVPGWSYDAKLGKWRERIPQVWRAYNSVEESIADYATFLSAGRYRGAWAVLASADPDVSDFSALLRDPGDGRAGYYNLPEVEYTAGLLASYVATRGVQLGGGALSGCAVVVLFPLAAAAARLLW